MQARKAATRISREGSENAASSLPINRYGSIPSMKSRLKSNAQRSALSFLSDNPANFQLFIAVLMYIAGLPALFIPLSGLKKVDILSNRLTLHSKYGKVSATLSAVCKMYHLSDKLI